MKKAGQVADAERFGDTPSRFPEADYRTPRWHFVGSVWDPE